MKCVENSKIVIQDPVMKYVDNNEIVIQDPVMKYVKKCEILSLSLPNTRPYHEICRE